ncbi:MAG: TlpA family protein disulfide reductase [Bacteroidales bacterium]|nr:TlpA family protein disulfide reductase [Bacteroidales bacterium]
MKTVLFIFLLAVSAPSFSQDIRMIDREGLEPYLTSDSDTTYLINFWATWCKPCVKEMPHFLQLNKELKGKAFKMVLIRLDFPSQIREPVHTLYLPKIISKQKTWLLDDPNSNAWIPLVSDKWSGAIPATLVYNSEKRSFYEQKLDYKKLKEIVKQYLKF